AGLADRGRGVAQCTAAGRRTLHCHEGRRMTAAEVPALTLVQLRELLQRGEISPREIIDALHDRITSVEPAIEAYLSIDLEEARKRADAADVSLPLGGVPVAVKDIINVAGQPCTCASRILRSYISPYDATIVRKLKAAGAIPFGKTNMDEFAMGSSTEHSAVKLTRNPWDTSRVPG